MEKWTRGIPLLAYGLSAIVIVVVVALSITEANKRDRATQILIATAQALERLTPASGLDSLEIQTPTATSAPAPFPGASPSSTATSTPTSLPTATSTLTGTPTRTSTVQQKPEPSRTPTSTSTPTASVTPAPSPGATHTLTTTPVARPSPTSTRTATRTSTPLPPTSRPTASPTPLSAGQFVLLSPRPEEPIYGPTEFKWRWTGELRPGQGFEVRVWRGGETPTGIHDSRQDNLAGKIIRLGNNTYQFSVDISDSAGVRGIDGDYLWTVVLVQVSPDYQDLGIAAEPGLLHFVGGEGEADEEPGGPPTSR